MRTSTCHFLTDNSLQSADKDQQEMRAVAEKMKYVFLHFVTFYVLDLSWEHMHGIFPFSQTFSYGQLLVLREKPPSASMDFRSFSCVPVPHE